jgi:hypothetical protein
MSRMEIPEKRLRRLQPDGPLVFPFSSSPKVDDEDKLDAKLAKLRNHRARSSRHKPPRKRDFRRGF